MTIGIYKKLFCFHKYGWYWFKSEWLFLTIAEKLECKKCLKRKMKIESGGDYEDSFVGQRRLEWGRDYG